MGAKENQVESYLHKQVVANGGMTYKRVSPGRNGVPDRIVVTKRGVFFVEVKSMDGTLSAVQKRTISELERLGGKCYVVYGTEQVDSLVEVLC